MEHGTIRTRAIYLEPYNSHEFFLYVYFKETSKGEKIVSKKCIRDRLIVFLHDLAGNYDVISKHYSGGCHSHHHPRQRILFVLTMTSEPRFRDGVEARLKF